MSRLKDEYTQQMVEEEYESLGEGARRDLFSLGAHGPDAVPVAPDFEDDIS